MSAVEENLLSGWPRNQLQPPGPVDAGQAGMDGVVVHRNLRDQCAHGSHCHRGVHPLMLTEQGQLDTVQRRLLHFRGREDRERRVLPAGRLRDHPERVISFRRGDDGDARFDDARLLRRNTGQCFPQPLLMIVLDVGDDTDQGRNDISGIQPSAQTGFPDHQVALLLGEVAQGHNGHDLKEGGVLGSRILPQIRGRRVTGRLPPPFLQQRLHLGDEPPYIARGDRVTVDLDALTKGDQVRRGEQADAQARRPIDALQHRAGRALPVGAGDVDEAQPLLRVAGQRGELERVGQAELRAKPAEAIQESDGVSVGHSVERRGFSLSLSRGRSAKHDVFSVKPAVPRGMHAPSEFRAQTRQDISPAFATAISLPTPGTRSRTAH